jgi:formylglycine-generating enzyme required for sulfatase activity/tRNA A-37 threonylcarbamoyl transferase component Bud32
MGLSVGMKLSTGEIVAEVRHGGFAEVGVLEDDFEGRKVVKRLSDEMLAQGGDAVAEAFFHECRILVTKLRDAPCVAPALLALRNLDGLGPVLFMSYVDGPSLRGLIRGGRQSLCQSIRMGGQIASAIGFAHDRDVRHRDLKPSNILLNHKNDIQVIDWGLSMASGQSDRTVGVVDYLSPARRVDPLLDDPADDVFALGVVMYECLIGGYPRESADSRHIRTTLAEAHALAPAHVLDLVCQMLSPHPAQRPTARYIADTLLDPELLADIAAREVEYPFCRECDFVAMTGTRILDCPICGKDMHERYANPPRNGMVRVPPGVFTHGLNHNQIQQALMAAGMGDDPRNLKQLASPEDPQREVFVPGFDIDITPVTNLAYAEFVEATNYPAPEDFHARPAMFPDHPVVNVTWRDALCYALWVGKRLSRPMEWEKAARGDKDNRTYPWGDVWQDNRCNHNRYPGHNFRTTNPVTAFTKGEADGRSPFGVVDMAGNVSEWISESRTTHAQGRDAEMRAVCGGGWSDPVAVHGAVSVQIPAAIDYKSAAVGFRCATDIVYTERQVKEHYE